MSLTKLTKLILCSRIGSGNRTTKEVLMEMTFTRPMFLISVSSFVTWYASIKHYKTVFVIFFNFLYNMAMIQLWRDEMQLVYLGNADIPDEIPT